MSNWSDQPADDSQRNARLVELAPDGIVIHDGVRIVAVNAAAIRLAGASRRDQLVGHSVDTILHPPFLKAAEAQLTGALASVDQAPAVRDTITRLDGRQVDVEVRAQVFSEHGMPLAHLVIRDISERLASEALAAEMTAHLQAAQRLDAVGALAGGVAHEVNNMLQVILGFGALLLDEPNTSPSAQADVREIVRAAKQAAVITRQLLEFSRHGVHRPQTVVLSSAMRELAPTMRRLLGENRRFALRLDETPAVWLDLGQLEQMVVNLLLNARHATSDEGHIVVSTGTVTVTDGGQSADGAEIPSGDYASVVVRDNGTGMSAATRARIFEPFFTTKSSDEGTGLGLAAVQGIMAQSGGFILVASALNSGTSMTLLWPALTAAREGGGAPDSAAGDGTAVFGDDPSRDARGGASTPSILVVDDEQSIRAVARRILERGGYHVAEATNGFEAIDHIAEHGVPSLVLSDLRMPGMGGIELARRLRERWPQLPMLLMSGYSAESIEQPGAIHHIEKPFTVAELLARIGSILSTAHAG